MDKKTVLIVDDEPQIHDVLQKTLSSARYHVVSGHNGEDAVRMTVGMKPDIILLDSSLPDGDCGDIVAAIREWSDAPVIALMAAHEDQEIRAITAAGVNDYVVKPCSPDLLTARIRAHLRAAEGRKLAAAS